VIDNFGKNLTKEEKSELSKEFGKLADEIGE
jgi:hypothetical protein